MWERLRTGTRAGIELTVSAARESMRDRVLGLAAEASYWTMLSLPPLLLALLTLTGQLGTAFGADYSEPVAAAILGWADGVFTGQTMREVVRPLVIGTLHDDNSGLLSLSLLLALWSGSAALGNYVSAITVAYDMEGLRSFWRTRLLSLGLYVGALIVGTILLPLLVLGPGVLTRLLTRLPGPDLTWLVTVGYWPLVSLLSVAALTSLYHVAVPVRTRWRRDLPGAIAAMVVWIAGSVALRTYLASGLRSDTGAAAAPIAVLLFFFLTALAVLIGAELNATIDDRWPDASTREGRRDARNRRARASGARRGGPAPGTG
ncbi:membrane protein [Amorphoplanes auranticolor]|uniref:Membrane protein n=2 Tax=Actinoplanes auranticolor TaxID=47988 RepID=A0A919SI78_9ACTN|nr:membrane protein [Actinoplanes auranticolor]